jgi:hypothetical protein
MTQRVQYLMTPDVLRLRTVQRGFSDAVKKNEIKLST